MAFTFWKQDPEFIHELSIFLKDRVVLEIFAGNGYLAKRLSEHGINIRSTSIFKGYDMTDMEMHFSVEELSADDAIRKYGETADVLLMSWPEANNDALKASIQFFNTANGDGKKIVYIGERTCLKKQQLGGCASDLFFQCFPSPERSFKYQGRSIEVAEVLSAPDKEVRHLITTLFHL